MNEQERENVTDDSFFLLTNNGSYSSFDKHNSNFFIRSDNSFNSGISSTISALVKKFFWTSLK